MSWLKLHPLSSLDTRDDKTNESRVCSDTESIYSNECASNRGYRTYDTLTVTRVLEQHGIPCCLVGVAALVFYGASRVRDYRLVKPWPHYSPYSLIQPVKSRGINYYFFLVPSVHVYIDCDSSNFTRSPRDTCDMLQLYDVIDGTNAKEKNKRGEEFGGRQRNKREMWQSLVHTKGDRLDWTKPKDVSITQHRVIGAPDP
ncbi:hypothetical protein BDV34DRAFT_215401 [Aspergillus parasiticus]|uniref:Uncharacterized protein n=1 Tax=Aspergillus parasiticus TaxID=5067 RepID=A0A5N6DBY7_ASPPA|nr:hypothetical protein BDV34DRAFT_215401 [Aspergillus parasiticus]